MTAMPDFNELNLSKSKYYVGVHMLQMLMHPPEEVPLVMEYGSHIAAGEGAIVSVAKEEVRTFNRLLQINLSLFR